MVKNPQKMSHLNIQFSSRGPKQKYKKVENFWRENCKITRFAKSNPTCETFSSIFNPSAHRNFYLRSSQRSSREKSSLKQWDCENGNETIFASQDMHSAFIHISLEITRKIIMQIRRKLQKRSTIQKRKKINSTYKLGQSNSQIGLQKSGAVNCTF